jgi:hypothetical protein
LNRYNAYAAIRKRAKVAGYLTPVGCHTWRATGITIYLENDGRLEHAQQMAGHESPRLVGTVRDDAEHRNENLASRLPGLGNLRRGGRCEFTLLGASRVNPSVFANCANDQTLRSDKGRDYTK